MDPPTVFVFDVGDVQMTLHFPRALLVHTLV